MDNTNTAYPSQIITHYRGKRIVLHGALAVLSALMAIGFIVICYVSYVQSNANFHVVDPGKFYRSARMSAPQLDHIVKAYGIKSVLNLEGARPDKDWYKAKVSVLDRLNVKLYNFRLSATKIVPQDQIAQILEIVKQAPKPLLVQCRDGADRTGLISALYEAKIMGHSIDDSYDQLSLYHGHFKYLGSKTEEMDDTYWITVTPEGTRHAPARAPARD